MAPLPPNPLGIKVLASASTGLFVDFIVIYLRFWSRKLKKQKLKTGDYLIIVAWFLAFADLVRKGIAYHWGVGLHMNQILATDPTHLIDAAKVTYAGYFLWIGAVTCIKLSILCLYLELFSCINWFLWCVRGTMTICVLYFLGFLVGLCVQCTPFEANYNPQVPGAKCGISLGDGFILSGSINLFLDFVLVVLPLPVIWTLKISGPKKLGVSAMFSLGILILVIVGIRFKLIKDTNPADFIHDGEPPGIIISLELYLGMISACLPFLSPPIGKMKSSVVESSLYGLVSNNRGTKNSVNDIHSASSLRMGTQSDHSQDGSTSAYRRLQEGDKAGRSNNQFPTNAWPGANGYGRDYKVGRGSNQMKRESVELNEIRLTSEWEVHHGSNPK